MSDLLLTYVGDDFTGSTDALECLASAGLRTALFTRPPTEEVLGRYEGLQAIGVATVTRTLAPAAAEIELETAFTTLRDLRPQHVHYKVCSTLDSSPTVGSIGCAIDVGQRVFGSRYIPLLVGAPPLGRYCAFGNLFATKSVGGDGPVFRLDRHPTASRHPTTPMQEGDIRVHLGRQTDAEIGLFDLRRFGLSADRQREELKRLIAAGSEVVLFDVVCEDQLGPLGALIDEGARGASAQFSVGSSGIEMALEAHWSASRRISPVENWAPPEPANQVLVVSGSCSPVTQSQIDWATKHGFAEIAIDTPEVAAADGSDRSIERATNQMIGLLRSGASVLMHTSKGRSDPRIAATASVFAERNSDSSQVLGLALGRMVGKALEQTSVRRLCIAGGDTASYVARQIGVEAIEMVCPLTRGAPLCSVVAPQTPADGLEVCFKGGQVGDENFFGSLHEGSTSRRRLVS